MAELNAPLETAYGELIRPRPVKPSDEPPSIVKEESKEESNPSTPDEKQVDNESNNDNIGNLSIDESGQLRYYGKSSGYYMLSGSKNFQDGAFHFNSRGYRSHPEFQQGSPQLLSIDPFQLPPQDLSDHLLDLYFTHFYPLLPLLHKKTFMASLQDPAHRPPPLLLNSIYAVASRISTDPRVKLEPNLPDTAGDIFLERARILLNFEWDGFKVSTVQSLLLLSSHQNGALKNIRGWLYSGLVSCIEMCGCYLSTS
jgi:hypothetical protein